VTFDPWSTTSEFTTIGTRTFKTTLVDRARKRVDDVKRKSGREFVVIGNSKLGDGYPEYPVKWLGGDDYSCVCETLSHGDTRANRGCSHVVAVMLYRDGNGFKIADGGSTTTSADRPQATSTQQLSITNQAPGGNERPNRDDKGASPTGTLPLNKQLTIIPSISEPSFYQWDQVPLPTKFQELRPHQWDAITEAMEHYERGIDVVYLDAPTGSGKSLIGELIRRLLQRRAFYICHSKTLQHQFMSDFPYARLLMGRSNYPTLDGGPEVTCADCTQHTPEDGCMWCYNSQECPYQLAKRDAILSKLAVINTAYFLTEFNYVGNVGKDRELGIVDECDTLEGELMGFAEFNVSDRMLSKLGLSAPKEGSHYTTISKWLVEQLKPGLDDYRKLIRGDDLKAIRERMSVSRMLADVLRIEAEVTSDPEMQNWIRDNKAGPMVLKPVTVNAYGERYVWGHAQKWLHMSATIVSPDELAQSCGNERKWEIVKVPMTFPVENRVINVAPVADMSRKGKDAGEWEYAATALRSICERHEGERVLVHTVSYELARFLVDQLTPALPSRQTLTYRTSRERDNIVTRFRHSEGAVLIAPSLDRGIDLAGDDCRVIVVMKIPFPYLGDPQVSKRMRLPGGQSWYVVQAVRKLVQMTGRGVRSADDWCVTYILDKQFTSNILKKHEALLPSWWKESLNTRFGVRELLRAG
jgi:ATP-dependent DNA helicase DinG